MNIPNSLRKLVAACAVSAAAQAGAVPVLLVNSDGVLTGANGVDVAGVLYNVTFADGSCNSVFDNCNPALFSFNTMQDSTNAANALLNQVFLDGPFGQFDSNPSTIFGCTSTRQCSTFIPYALSGSQVLVSSSNNYAAPFGFVDGVTQPYFPTDFNTSNFDGVNYAVFQLASTDDVPEPSSIALMALAMAGLAFAHRRKV